jgi:hypothetical protein
VNRMLTPSRPSEQLIAISNAFLRLLATAAVVGVRVASRISRR